MSLTSRMLLGLAAGLVVGAAVHAWPGGALRSFADVVEPVGKVWVNALQMTVIPLVVSLIVSSIGAAADARVTGRLGLRALLVFLGFLTAAGVVSSLAAPPVIARLPVDAGTAAALRADAAGATGAAAETVQRLPTFGQMLVDIVPVNPVRAAADGAMLPLVLFALLLGLAATRLPAERRNPLVGLFRGVADAMLVIVGWIIAVAPVGVFALAASLAARTGLAAAGALALYVVLLTSLVLLVTSLLYAAAAVGGGVPVARFARAVAPAQAVAFSARSSLAALPAMLEASRTSLALPPAVTSFVLPLAVSTLRVSTPIMWAVTIPFLARLYGVPLGYAQLAWLVAAGILLSFSIPGLPSASLFLMAPFLVGLGIPADALGIVLAVDAVPDLFKGMLNVTGHMAAASIVARHAPLGPVPVSA